MLAQELRDCLSPGAFRSERSQALDACSVPRTWTPAGPKFFIGALVGIAAKVARDFCDGGAAALFRVSVTRELCERLNSLDGRLHHPY